MVTGRVGAGKTTLLRTLLGLLPPPGGRDPVERPGRGRRRRLLCAAALPPTRRRCRACSTRRSGRTSCWGCRTTLPPWPVAVRGAVLEHDVQALEAGLETLVGSGGVKLSGGQVQRAAAARMFVRGAELLVIDDLSSALDVETESAPLGARMKNEEVRRKNNQAVAAFSFLPSSISILAVSHHHAALQARGSDHRAQGWACRGAGHAGRAAGLVRRDAAAVGRRNRMRGPP